jgi:hypothetical protein
MPEPLKIEGHRGKALISSNQIFPQQAATFEKQYRQLFRSKLRGMYPLRFNCLSANP